MIGGEMETLEIDCHKKVRMRILLKNYSELKDDFK